MNWKIIAIIAATAIATAAAVVFVLQKQSCKRKMRFDSAEFDDDDFMDDIACGEQCSYMDDSIELNDKSENAAADAAGKVEEVIEEAADAVEEVIEEVKDSTKK